MFQTGAIRNLSTEWSELTDLVVRECDRSNRTATLRDFLHVIQDIPYGRASSTEPESVLRDWRGTCSGKHLLGYKLLSACDYAPRLYLGRFRLKPEVVPIEFPEFDEIQDVVWDVHNFLKAGPDSNIVDLTWPSFLIDHGFQTTRDWKEWSDFELAAPVTGVEEIDPSPKGLEYKSTILKKLNGKNQAVRERYIAALTQRIAELYGDESHDRERVISRAVCRGNTAVTYR